MDLARKLRIYHLIGMPIYHIMAIGLAIAYPPTRTTLILFLATYTLQSMGISVGYHRLFSHKAFKANRALAFCLGLMGGLAGQGPIRRWASDHRVHHRYTDKAGDPHSPHVNSFWYSHLTWRFDPHTYRNERENKKIWSEWPVELVWLDRFIPALFLLHPLVLGLIGGWAFVGWGYFIPVVILWHVTFTVNSVSHRFGSRLFETPDFSRNSMWISLIMWGEGWHNNHHASPKNVRFGMRWYQIDLGYFFIKNAEKLGLTHQLIDQSESEIRSALANTKT